VSRPREQRQALLEEFEDRHLSLEWLLQRFLELERSTGPEQVPVPQVELPKPVIVEMQPKPTRPNPRALADLVARLNWFLAKREMERGAKNAVTTIHAPSSVNLPARVQTVSVSSTKE
jgi:hypothetical protein